MSEAAAISLDDETNLETAESPPTGPDRREGLARTSFSYLSRVAAFRHQIETMQGRIEALRHREPSDEPEVFQALDTTMEELRVAAEDLRQTNDALRESRLEVELERKRYRDLFNLAPDAYLVTDFQAVVREANHAACAQLNIAPSFLVGKPLVLFVPEEDRMTFRAELGRLRGVSGTLEYDARLKPRRLPPFEASIRVSVVRDPWGQALGLRWAIRDISDRLRAEEQIRALNEQLEREVADRSEQLGSALQTHERWLIKAHDADLEADPTSGDRFFREIVEEVDAILWRADAATGRYTFVSRRAEELLGYPPSRWLDEPDFWLQIIHPEDRDLAAGFRRNQLREGVGHEGEYRVVARDGRTLWFREAVRRLPSEPDGAATTYGLMVNISKRKKFERQLYTAKGKLTSQLRDMTYLHELGRRLAAPRGWTATLDEVASATGSLQGADLVMLWLVDEAEGGASANATLAASSGLPEALADWFRVEAHAQRFAQAIRSTEPLAIEDVRVEPETSVWRELGQKGEVRAASVVPLFSEDREPLGWLVAGFPQPYRMGERLSRLVEIYSGMASRAIEAARDYRSLQESLAALLATVDPADAGARDQAAKIRRLLRGF